MEDIAMGNDDNNNQDDPEYFQNNNNYNTNDDVINDESTGIKNENDGAGEEGTTIGTEEEQQQQVDTTSTSTTNNTKKYSIDIRTMPIPPRASELITLNENEPRVYWDRSHYESPEKQLRALSKSSTLYVGNLNFTTRAAHIRHHFGLLGIVNDVIMGVDRYKKLPCGFCFVVYHNRIHALEAVALLSGTKLDGSVIRVELDAGFQNGRQYGRGQSGGQVRHDRKQQQQQQRTNNFGSNSNNRSYNAGDKRSRTPFSHDNAAAGAVTTSTGENTNETTPSRPRIDEALPTGRKHGSSDADTNVMDPNTTNETNNNDYAPDQSGEPDDDNTNNAMEEEDDNDRPSKRQRT